MAEWRQFCTNNDNYWCDVTVGLYDEWLATVGFGPTQADRVLIHSPMMEQAHERRFVVAELGLNNASFESEHQHRMQDCVDRLLAHFLQHQDRTPSYLEPPNDDLLLGLVQSPTGGPQSPPPETFQSLEPTIVLEQAWEGTVNSPSDDGGHGSQVTPWEIKADENLAHEDVTEEMLRHIAMQIRLKNKPPFRRPRQRKTIRIRKEALSAPTAVRGGKIGCISGKG